MTTPNPITPPPELFRKWATWRNAVDAESFWRRIATEAAQWGADQELEACCEWLCEDSMPKNSNRLRNARRPKPPSLKEQALKMLRPLSNPVMPGTPEYRLYEPQAEIIRRALEALDD